MTDNPGQPFAADAEGMAIKQPNRKKKPGNFPGFLIIAGF